MIQIKNLNKSYQNTSVFTDFNLKVGSGESLSVIGESGSGKSTLLNILGGIDAPNSGEVLIYDHSITKLSEQELTQFRADNLGFIYQFHHLLPDFTILENVYFALIIQNIDKKTAIQCATEILERVGLGDKLESFPSQVSGGQRQRAAIARAMVKKPALILADEPTGNLDEKNSMLIMDLLLELQRESNSSLIIATHNIELSKKTTNVISV